MTKDRSSAGNPARTLALLWRDAAEGPRRGPRRGLDLDVLVSNAIALADADGLTALTMRKVAERVGAGVMTLYTYVADRNELLDLMLDTTYAQMPREDTTGLPWRARVAAVAEQNHEMYKKHPWAAEVSTLRPPLGPGQMAKYEHELAAFDDCGLDDEVVDDCLTQVSTFVRVCAYDAESARSQQKLTGMNDEQWWAIAGPLLSRVLHVDRYPRAVRIGTAAGGAHGSAHDPDHVYHFGLERLLDGLAALIEAPGRVTSPTPGRE